MEENYSDDEGVVLKRRSVKLTLIDSDDDEALGIPSGRTDVFTGDGDSSGGEDDGSGGKENSALEANRNSKRRLVAWDSGSDSSDGEGPKTAGFTEPPHKPPPPLVFKDKDLYDDETSDLDDDDKMAAVNVARKYAVAMREGGERPRKTADDAEEDEDFRPAEGDVRAGKPSKKLQSRKAKTAAMEGIELIHSETQRLLRESRLSLPYHRPKQHSITEFLQRRSLRTAANTTGADNSQQDLTLIWKELEERTKEAEAFYKSDSDTEEEEESRDPVVNDALKDSGILSAAASFDGEASSSPVDGDGRDPTTAPSEAAAPSGDDGLNVTEGSAETSGGPDVEGVGDPPVVAPPPGDTREEVQAEETTSSVEVQDHCGGPHNSPEVVSRGVQGKVEETSPDLFLSQSQSVSDNPGKDIFSEENEEEPSRRDTADLDVAKTTGAGVASATPSRAALLLSRLGDVKPRLSCGEDDLVDLTGGEDSAPRSGVEKLISRFIKHTGATTPAKGGKKKESQVPVSVVSVEKDEAGVEQVKADTVYVPVEEESVAQDPSLARPGAKLQRLKQELNREMARQRELEWARRQREFKMDEEEIDDEKSVCGLLDDEREADLSSESETEEEEEEDDVPLVEKKRTKSAFVDDEAEVSEDDEEAVEDSAGRGDDDDEAEGAQDTEEEEEEEEEETPRPEDSGKKSKLRRIKTFDMFETDEEKSEDEGEEDVGNVSVVSTLNIPPYQPGGAITQPPRQEPGSITPLLKVPLLRGVISSHTNLNDSSLLSPCEATQPLSEEVVDVEVNQAKKKLFNQSELGSTQDNMAELMDVCSGTFSGKMPSELLGLCSGKFLTQPLNMESLEKDDEEEELLEDTQPVFLLPEDRPTSTGSSLGRLRYQDSENAQFPDQTTHTPPRLRLTIDSSDEDTEDGQQGKKKKDKKIAKKNLKLYFSDEEEEDGETSDRTVDYDSEENEIDPQEEEEGRGRGKAEARGFFEAEAELSESEWGSEDEDERDLDKLEWEEGDADKLNEKKVREQLEKIHMRRVLDEDQREVRILQELLLEDGEFHSDGPGRERKFRWRNTNIAEMQRDPQDSDDENGEEGEEEQDEVEWRKKRLERETFLMEQKEKAALAGRDFEEELGAEEDADSQLLQLGKAALRRMRSHNSDHQAAAAAAVAKDPQQSPNHKYPFRLLTKRGSFLSRSEVALARIAHITRGAGSTVSTGPKHSRNFVFATLSPEKMAANDTDTTLQDEDVKPAAKASSKRKTSNGGTAAASLLKKPRLSSGKGMGLFDHLEQLTTPS